MNLKSLVLLGLLALFAWTKPASAESYHTCNGYITSVPVTISTPGVWCMYGNITSSLNSTLITVNTNNVTIDCNGHFLTSTAGVGNTATGIYAYFRNNTTVRNCAIRGFKSGVWLVGSTGRGNVVEDNVFDGNTYVALTMNGDGSVARRNQVLNTGGTTVYSSVYGIYAFNSVDLIDNTVSGVTARSGSGGSAYGIYTSSNTNGSINDNRVRALVKDGAGYARGIYNVSSGRLSMRGNDVVGDASAGGIGLYCSSSAGRARDNTINGFATGISGCTTDPGNVIAP
jgi:hypothetical protein